MTDPFINIRLLLSTEEQDGDLPVSTLFDGIYLPQHRLQLHFISLSHPLLENTEADYFKELSDRSSEQKIRIIHLWEDIYYQNQVLVESRILSLMGKRKRIHARQTSVIRIDKKQADEFLQHHHLQKNTSAYYKYGLIKEDELVAVATFSKSRTMTDGVVPYRSYELERFASKQGTTVTGGLGKLLNHFIGQHHPSHLMTYADRDWSAGAGYEKLGFELSGYTAPQVFYVHPDEKVRYPANRLPASITPENAQQKGYIQICNAGNLKYILDRRT